MHITYRKCTISRLGHASIRVATPSDKIIYIDPWSKVLDETPKDGDLVLVSHADHDHFDPDGIEAVAGPGAKIGAHSGIDTAALNRPSVSLPSTGETVIDEFKITAVPAYNRSAGDHVDTDGTPFHREGEVTGLCIECDDNTIFYPSDTDFLPHHEEIAADILLPPIGGHYTMDRHEATELTLSVSPDVVIPIHYDTFEAIETDAAAFAEDVSKSEPDIVISY
jgi:L-ascorbate metabolism protein UlaG (beta-lactamase superfamily)